MMPVYQIWASGDAVGDAWWIQASSTDEARRLVALNVAEAREATDASKFNCEPDKTKEPPVGMIYRRLNGPLSVKE